MHSLVHNVGPENLRVHTLSLSTILSSSGIYIWLAEFRDGTSKEKASPLMMVDVIEKMTASIPSCIQMDSSASPLQLPALHCTYQDFFGR
jgi:hypothetical protein